MIIKPIIGLTLIATLLFSGYFGVIIWMTPFLVVLLINPNHFVNIAGRLLSVWLRLAIALFYYLGRVRVRVYGEPIRREDRALIIMNHRSRQDWLHIWHHLIANRCEMDLKIMLKDELRHVPGVGWGIQNNLYMLISRSWNRDRVVFARFLDMFEAANHRTKLLIFPEGTDFDEHSRPKSDSYAKKMGLPYYFFCLHPRTTGFVFLLQRLYHQQRIDAIYDVTVVYPKNQPQGELEMAMGDFPAEVCFHIKRHDISEFTVPLEQLEQIPASVSLPHPVQNGYVNGTLPGSAIPSNTSQSKEQKPSEPKSTGQMERRLMNEGELIKWLEACWARKENFLYETYAAIGLERVLPQEWRTEIPTPRVVYLVYLGYLVLWAGFLAVCGHLVLNYHAFRLWLLAVSIFYFTVTYTRGGVHMLQIYHFNPHFRGVDWPKQPSSSSSPVPETEAKTTKLNGAATHAPSTLEATVN